MEFRAHVEAAKKNAIAFTYLTEKLADVERGRVAVQFLIEQLGSAVDRYPDWHPIINAQRPLKLGEYSGIRSIPAFQQADHTVLFVGGFVTCPYSEDRALEIESAANKISGLSARLLGQPLYAEGTYPVVVSSLNLAMEPDGTIVSRDALTWFSEQLTRSAHGAQVAETWWNIRMNALGAPHGARSSLMVNQHTGIHMRKILETLNNSGIFGPLWESNLDMIPKSQRDLIAKNLIWAAIKSWSDNKGEFNFHFRDEICWARISDAFGDGAEYNIKVIVGDNELSVNGFYDVKKEKISWTEPVGKQKLAKKFR